MAPGIGGARPPVSWAVERMTHRGGWETVATWEDGPPDPKTPYSVRPPSKFRCVRRRGGRIDKNGVEWTVEHPDAAERYERLRLRDEIRERTEALVDDQPKAELYLKLLDDFPDPKIPKQLLKEMLEDVEALEERDPPPEPGDRDPADRLAEAMLEGELSVDEADEVADAYSDIQDAREPSLAEQYLAARRQAEDEDEETESSG